MIWFLSIANTLFKQIAPWPFEVCVCVCVFTGTFEVEWRGQGFIAVKAVAFFLGMHPASWLRVQIPMTPTPQQLK